MAMVMNTGWMNSNGSLPAVFAACLRGADGELLAAAAGRDQADAGFDQADVALQRNHPLGGVHQELAAAAQRHALYRRDHRHLGILEAHRSVLELGDIFFEQLEFAASDRFGHLLEIGTESERRLVPQHQAREVRLGAGDGCLQCRRSRRVRACGSAT
jgi:hypothetical protein